VKVLLGGGTQHNLTRIIARCNLPDVTFDYVTSDDEPQVWRRKARHADVAIVRTGWISHKAWRSVKAVCADVVPLAQNGEEVMLDAIHDAHRKGTTWMKLIGWW
jgi:hypothetical protein